ncbi:MAG: 16S rRNA (guanine(527)-N(7))-methyltransferase RsmG [Sphingobium sp.]|nr:16S rRNA (guanine(527)-N(7))-methyltransferase RsmG [Sphingobium sp.]
MTEEEARIWLQSNFDVSRETWDRLERYVAILLTEMANQNLIAESTRDHVWARHIVDSAQLLKLVPPAADGKQIWADLGAGAGLPGIVVAILSGYHVKMIEMRRKRVEFLEYVIQQLGLNASVFGGKVEQAGPSLNGPVSVISARAYAPMDRLIASALPLARKGTIWVLPKGQNFQNELDIAQTLWHSDASVAPSLTAEDSAILVLKNVRKKGRKA